MVIFKIIIIEQMSQKSMIAGKEKKKNKKPKIKDTKNKKE